MSLIDRLAGVPGSGERLPVSYFYASLVELAEDNESSGGNMSRAKIVSYFNLDATEETELDWLISKYNAQPNAAARDKFLRMLYIILDLAEGRVPGYLTNTDLVARINRI